MRRSRIITLWLLLSIAAWLLAADRVWGVGTAVQQSEGWDRLPSAMSAMSDAVLGIAPQSVSVPHRLLTRAEHSVTRIAAGLRFVAVTWLWILFSAAVFLLVSAFASVADFRMFALRREAPGELSRYLGYGLRTFFRVLRDRRTPNSARLILAAALVYWLVPLDLIPDSPVLPGFVDDVVVALVAAKAFIYLCPESLVTQHAVAVRGRAGV